MLKLRRATVVSVSPLKVEIEGVERRAWADPGLVGECELGDDVIVNVEALDLGLGSGGFDIVHVNLTRGLAGEGSLDEHVMKLNYSSLQHPVGSIERPVDDEAGAGRDMKIPVLAIGLHGHLAPAAWAVAERARREGRRRPRVGYIQTGGGALPGAFSRDVRRLLDLDLVAGHVTAGPAYGGQAEAITLVGAIDAAESLAWDAVIAGPGPGILGSATVYGHGGMVALDVAHSGLSLGAPVVLSPRLSSGDPRPRHQGLSHHSRSVLKLLLAGVDVPLPEGREDLAGAVAEIGEGRHRAVFEPVDIAGYAASGLPRSTMGRDIEEDPEFFSGPLAAGSRLSDLAVG
ncbi:MAG TPA: DUF3866 family protein [Solirubrobacterales bacterium]|nr:DUF3866 family protein [Solirubrobacterales bacterium]